MMGDDTNEGAVGRRRFLRSAALTAAGLASAPAFAQHAGDHSAHNPAHGAPAHDHEKMMAEGGRRPMMGVFGTEGRGPGRPVIAMLVHPAMVMQDFIGPLTVFNIMHSEIHLVWKDLNPVSTEVGIPVTPSTLFADCPDNLDVLFVPGGLNGSMMVMQDTEVLAFLADRGKTARYVTSDCTGALVLGAAGLLQGYKATGYWQIRDQLALMGATPVHERVVVDRNRVTGGGVTAGIDFGLTLAAILKGEDEAKRIQLTIEYAPQPPFNAGTPETAPKAIYDRIMTSRGPAIQKAADLAAAAGKRLKI